MEILDSNIFPVALFGGLALSAMSVVLLMVITTIHWQTGRLEKHSRSFRQMIEPLITRYLENQVSEEIVIDAIQQEPSEALILLMKLSRKLPLSIRPRLQPLFNSLPLVDTEIDALSSRHGKRRLLAAERLGYLRHGASAEALLYALEDELIAVRFSAAQSLAAHGKTEAIEQILLTFDVPDEMRWQRVVEIIVDYGPSVAPIILTVLESRKGKYSNNIINVAIRALGIFRTAEAVQPLINLLDSPEYSIRLNAAHALGEIGDPAAITPVAALGNDPAWRVRNEAVEAMGKLHAERQIPMLTHALTDSSWWVRFSAAQTLHSLGQPGITELKEVMKNTIDRYARDICRQVLEEHHIFDTKKNPS